MKPFAFWNNLGTAVAFVTGTALALTTGNVWWVFSSLVIQNLFVGGVYIGKWHTTRPWENR